MEVRIQRQDTDETKAIAFDGFRLTVHEANVRNVWDASGRLLEVHTTDAAGRELFDVRYSYDAFGRKSFRQEGAFDFGVSQFTYDGLNVVLEIEPISVQVPQMAFFYGAGVNELVAVDLEVDGPGVTSAIGTTWSFADLQGTVRSFGWYDDDGDEWQLVHRNSGEFGEESLLSLGAINFPFLRNAPSYWAGHQKDATTGLTDMKARWYDPGTQMFVSQDGTGFAGGDANFNRYVGNSPTNATDQSSLIVVLNPTCGRRRWIEIMGGNA